MGNRSSSGKNKEFIPAEATALERVRMIRQHALRHRRVMNSKDMVRIDVPSIKAHFFVKDNQAKVNTLIEKIKRQYGYNIKITIFKQQ